MLNKKPIIFATGCSFTDANFMSRHEHLPDEKRGGWPMWPELIKEKIEKETGISYELVNLAKSGASNEYVFNSCLDSLSKYDKRIKIVLVGGTQWMRSHVVPTRINYNPQVALDLRTDFIEKNKEWLSKPTSSWLRTYNQATIEMWAKWSNEFGIQQQIYHNLRIMWSLAEICNSKNIKFIWNQLLTPFPGYRFWKDLFINYGISEEELVIARHVFEEQFFANTVLKSSYAKFLVQNKKQFYGFPWSIGEYWDRGSTNIIQRHPEIVMPPTIVNGKEVTDAHPSRFGQETIARQMWKEYGNYLVKN
jgi:hypothetical protein